jgi:hypothetical protein
MKQLPAGLGTLVFLASVQLPGIAAAQCESAVDAAKLSETLHTAEYSYGKLDVEGFKSAVDDATEQLPCLNQALGPQLAARYHRLRGLHLYVIRDKDSAALSFAAARDVDPAYEFPENLIPAGHAGMTPFLGPVEMRVRR